MNPPAPAALDRGALPWLFATALATTLPHAEHQPVWLSAATAGALVLAATLWWRGRRLPRGWFLALAVVAGCAGIVVEFRTLFGRDAGVAMLVLFMALKLLELRSLRDAHVTVMLGYFLLLTHYFYSQSIPTGLWLLVSLLVATATLIRLHGGPASPALPTLRYAGLLLLQAAPFMLVLYLLFPRIAGPLWGLPQDAHSARSGLSEQIAPGSIANLVQSADIAFRVRFEGVPPGRDKLYWRGPVLENFDGATWRRRPAPGPEPAIDRQGPTYRYETTLEPHQQAWLLALDAPTTLPANAYLTPTLTAVSREPVRQRQRYAFASAVEHRFNLDEGRETLRRNRLLPGERNPRARRLAAQWLVQDADPERLVGRALALFSGSEFAYTLQPPLLGENPVDDFLFTARRGFCEHYASAFAVLMRAAGVPARVVGGYQGGEPNPVDGYWVIRQSDAHAWAEVWLEKRGWVRVDPTAEVAPARLESGIAAAIPAGEPLPALVQFDADWLKGLRYRWEAANNAWNQYVLGYNPERQREFLSRLGLPDADWRSLVGLLAGACGGVLLAVVAATLYRRPRADPALRLWRRALVRLKRRQVQPAPGETPLALARRLAGQRPDLAPAVAAVAAAYCRARYGPDGDLETLRTAVAELP